MDTESIGGACWNDPGNNHTWDRKPCPWIRRFWNMDALATTAVDTILPMDTYGTNDTQLPFFLQVRAVYLSAPFRAMGVKNDVHDALSHEMNAYVPFTFPPPFEQWGKNRLCVLDRHYET